VAVGYPWMVEIPRFVPPHSQTLHYRQRAVVFRNRECDDFIQPEMRETVVKRRVCRLGSISLSPVTAGQAPPDLVNAAGEQRSYVDRCNPGETDTLPRFPYLDREKSLARLVDLSLEAVHQCVGLDAVRPEREIFHDPVVGIDLVKQVPVFVAPVAQQQPGGLDRKSCHSKNSDRR
jgi:hypothetical protein